MKFPRFVKRMVSHISIWAIVLSTFAFSLPMVYAAPSFVLSTQGLSNGFFDAPIKVSSAAQGALKVVVTGDAADQTLTSITVNFSGTGFATSDLDTLGTGASSGVSLWTESSESGFTTFSTGSDTSVTINSPSFSGSSLTLTPATPVALNNGSAKTFYVAIKTSATAAENDKIILTVPQNGVVTSAGNGPSGANGFAAPAFKVDATAPTITAVETADSSADLTVRFSEPVQAVDFGAIDATSDYSYTDNSGGGKSISSVSHQVGQNIATVTLSGNVAIGDLTGPSTLAAGSSKIMDMAGNVMGTATTNFSSVLQITTPSIRSTYVGEVTNSGAPLVDLDAAGGPPTHTFSVDEPHATNLSNLGLSLASDGKITGTTANATGSHNITFKVTDNNSATATRPYTINIAATEGGGIPGVTNVSPGGGPQNTSTQSITITGSNTNWTNSTTAAFAFPPGDSGTNGIGSAGGDGSSGNPTVVRNSATSITVSFSIKSDATAGPRDIKITTGTEVITVPGGFSIFGGGSSGLSLLLPSDNQTNVQIPPRFTFNPSDASDLESYGIQVFSDGQGTNEVWSYKFPKPADGQNSNGSHCDSNVCDLEYGAGHFKIDTQPLPLSPNTDYWWKVSTYDTALESISFSTPSIETSPLRGFKTVTSVNDVEPPEIFHRPVFKAVPTTDLKVFYRVFDNIASPDTTPALASTLYYCAGSSCTPSTTATGTHQGSGYFMATIPGATISSPGTKVRYYITATDGSNTSSFKSSASPVTITTTATGTDDMSGTVVNDSGTCAADAFNSNFDPGEATIFLDGTGFTTTSAAEGGGSECQWTISNVYDGVYDVVAFKSGWSDRVLKSVKSSATGVTLKIKRGAAGGIGGDSTKPRVIHTKPGDMQGGVPGGETGFGIQVQFDSPMSQLTINSTNMKVYDATNPSSPSEITSNGAWTYSSSNNTATWTLSGANTFGDNKMIGVVINPEVTDTGGNQIEGKFGSEQYQFGFQTGSTASFDGFNADTGTFSGGGTFGQGAFAPPHIVGSFPMPGGIAIPTNVKPVINFSEPMAADGGGYTLESNVKLFTVGSDDTETDVSSTAIDTVTLDSGGMSATVTLASGFNSGAFAASTRYRLKVLGGAKAQSGMTLGTPDQSANAFYVADFKTGTGADNTAPTLMGTYPSDGATNHPVNAGHVLVKFDNKPLSGSTINSNTAYLAIGSSKVSAEVEYLPFNNEILIIPQEALSPDTTYDLVVTADVTGLNGQAITAIAQTFTTGTADTASPSLEDMRCDDYSCALTFSEPMNAAGALDSSNFATSVLNPLAYNIVKYGDAGFSPGAAGTTVSLSGITFTWDGEHNTVIMEGFDLASQVGKDFAIMMDSSGSNEATDISGNGIGSTGVAQVIIENSATTKGDLFGGFGGGKSMDEFMGEALPTHMDSSTFGFAPPVEVRPFSTRVSTTSVYDVRVPISKQIDAGGVIELTFPTGWDISGAKQDPYAPHFDLNGPGSGTVKFKCNTTTANTKICSGDSTISGDGSGDGPEGGLVDDGITVNTDTRKVTATLSAATNADGFDMIGFKLDGITSSSVAKMNGTQGYTVTVKTKSASGRTLETFTSLPFFLQEAGNYTLSGTITATGNNQSGTIPVYLFSPQSGPLSTTSANFSGGTTAAYSFTGLSVGDYEIFTDPFVTINNAEFAGLQPRRVRVNEAADTSTGDNANDNVIDEDFTIVSNTSGGTTVTLSVDGPSSETLDVFAHGPNGFRSRTITLDGDAGAESITLSLPDGEWHVGVGPAMPKGFTNARPPEPNFLPPKPIRIRVENGGSPAVREASGTANDGTLVFTLTSTSKTIRGVVKDDSDKVVADAEVFGYDPVNGIGAFAQTDAEGQFTLNVADGTFKVGAHVPGMPPSREVGVEVTSDATTYLKIDGATAITPAAAASSFVLKMTVPSNTISGSVSDATGNVIQGAGVYAYRTDGPGHAHAQADESGNYKLYVNPGTWKVGAHLQGFGELTEKQFTVTAGTNLTAKNFSPSEEGTFHEIAGQVTVGGSGVEKAHVEVCNTSTGYCNGTVTDDSGNYSLNVPEDASANYVAKAYTPLNGALPETTAFAVSSDVSSKNLSSGTARTVSVTLSSAVDKGRIKLIDANGNENEITLSSEQTTKEIRVPDGTYNVQMDIAGVPIDIDDIAANDGNTAYSSSSGSVVVNGTEGLTITVPTLRTVSGTAKDDSNNNLANALVSIRNPATGVTIEKKTASDGTYSFSVPDDATNQYILETRKPGFVATTTKIDVNGSNSTGNNLTATEADNTITGTVKDGSDAAIPNAFVRAKKQGGGEVVVQADADGNYSLPVTDGTWRVYGIGDGYAEAEHSSGQINTADGSLISKDIALTVTVDDNKPPASKSVTPSTGGVLDKSDIINDSNATGVKLEVPANALGSDSSAGTLTATETNSFPDSATAEIVGGKATDVSAVDASSQPITNLDGEVTYSEILTKAELAATTHSNGTTINTMAEAQDMKVGKWDTASQDWVTLSTTVTFLDSDGAPIVDLSTIDTASEFDTNVAYAKVEAETDSFSLFAPLVATDASAPDTPSGLAATAASTTAMTLTWTQVSGATSYDIYRSSTSGGTFSRLGSEPTVSSGSTTTYSDTGLSAGTTYYYKITSLNSSGESAASSEVSGTTTSASSGGGGGGGGGGGSFITSSPSTTTSEKTDPDDGSTTTTDATVTTTDESTSAKVVTGFSDTKGHWASAYIKRLNDAGIVSGYGNGKYGPQDKVTRAQITKIALEAFGIGKAESIENIVFKDVKNTSDWFAPYLEAAYLRNIVSGYKDGSFKPNRSVSRAEALKILFEAAGLDVPSVSEGGLSFPDVGTSQWYAKYVSYASAKGVVGGYSNGRFGPNDGLTRGQVAKIVSLLMDLKNK